MFGSRPKYDDTFGTPMDLGADRKDPLAAATRPATRLAGKQADLVSTPRSLGTLFGSRAETRKPKATPRAAPQDGAPPPPIEADLASVDARATLRDLEERAMNAWRGWSAPQKIGGAIAAFWFLAITGLLFPAIIAAVIYFSVRRNRG